ncbi:tellurite resistance TerB family protein [Halosimplex salinum]|uniref:tellurite resistance TerB family protein n=1 Tax=Halosimplex salinum TaxID=1710538 RepID=UPI0013DDA8F1|nr:TerB family tellurite resistance protein [Halosimplex salinum]
MGLMGILGALVAPLLGLAAVFGGTWAFYRVRTAVATLAGATAGLVVGMTVGVGAPAVGGGVVGAAAGLAAARYHTRGGSIAVGAATGLCFGPLVALLATGSATPVTAIGTGLALGLVLAGVAWRFPRGAVLVGTSSMVGFLSVGVEAGLRPSLDTLSSGAMVGVAPETAGGLLYILPMMTLAIGVTMQPVVLEYSESVPPLYPGWFRRLFGFESRTGPTPEHPVGCASCGTVGEPGVEVCHACGDGGTEYGVPDGAVAVDVPCPYCGTRPIEETADATVVTGYLLAYKIESERHLACHACLRDQLWGSAKRTALTGWFSITCILMNPFVIAYDLGRGLLNRGPTTALVGALEDAGVEYSFLEDTSAFDPSGHADDELVLQGLVAVGSAVMLADGSPTPEEAEVVRDAALESVDGYTADEVEAAIERSAAESTDPATVAEALAGALPPTEQARALSLADAVARADGETTRKEQATIRKIGGALDVDEDDVGSFGGAPVGAGSD